MVRIEITKELTFVDACRVFGLVLAFGSGTIVRSGIGWSYRIFALILFLISIPLILIKEKEVV